MSTDGLKELQDLRTSIAEDQEKINRILKLAINTREFHNANKDEINVLALHFGKPLDTVTDQELQDYFDKKISAVQIEVLRTCFIGVEKMKTETVKMKDSFPPLDITVV